MFSVRKISQRNWHCVNSRKEKGKLELCADERRFCEMFSERVSAQIIFIKNNKHWNLLISITSGHVLPVLRERSCVPLCDTLDFTSCKKETIRY
jgi:hypothetical protein